MNLDQLINHQQMNIAWIIVCNNQSEQSANSFVECLITLSQADFQHFYIKLLYLIKNKNSIS